MPNVKSAIKRVRQNIKRRDRNRSNRAAFRTVMKKAEAAISAGDAEAAKPDVQAALKTIGTAHKKGLIHANKAARQSSRLTKKLNALQGKTAE